jgi:hypothetical protein
LSYNQSQAAEDFPAAGIRYCHRKGPKAGLDGTDMGPVGLKDLAGEHGGAAAEGHIDTLRVGRIRGRDPRNAKRQLMRGLQIGRIAVQARKERKIVRSRCVRHLYLELVRSGGGNELFQGRGLPAGRHEQEEGQEAGKILHFVQNDIRMTIISA